MVPFTMSAIRNDMIMLNPSARHPIDIDVNNASSHLSISSVQRYKELLAHELEGREMQPWRSTLVGLPGVDDAVVVAVEEGDVLLHHAHVVVPVSVRAAVRVVDVRDRKSSRQICPYQPIAMDEYIRNFQAVR